MQHQRLSPAPGSADQGAGSGQRDLGTGLGTAKQSLVSKAA